ncbi:hypothetical protein [Neobacillus bataviensis]|uniref:hypothetical protein n=1 Tax=Neobacillus bataviensis TaxID=220685 RepID=UPI001CBC912E|nr:hypothetical protein [Neobacillus bataviensis]
MEGKEKDREQEDKEESIHTMDQGLDLIFKVVNNMTGLDKGNDGIDDNYDKKD